MSEVPGNFAPKGRAIIEAVLKRRNISAEDFFSRSQTSELMHARMEAAKLMNAIGYSQRRIASIIGRDRRSVRYYLTEDLHEKQRQAMRRTRALAPYPQEVADLIAEIAKAKGADVRTMITGWVSERAAHEARSLAKVAA